jgi:hypothetical protein
MFSPAAEFLFVYLAEIGNTGAGSGTGICVIFTEPTRSAMCTTAGMLAIKSCLLSYMSDG